VRGERKISRCTQCTICTVLYTEMGWSFLFLQFPHISHAFIGRGGWQVCGILHACDDFMELN
jgi:hypothetical protein